MLASFHLRRCRFSLANLARRYQDRNPGIADLCLIRMSELYPDRLMITVDNDFRVYRRNRREAIPLLPATAEALSVCSIQVFKVGAHLSQVGAATQKTAVKKFQGETLLSDLGMNSQPLSLGKTADLLPATCCR